MAIYHLSVKTISRSAGRSATAAAAYRASCKIADNQTGEIHDYTHKKGVVSAELHLPENAPDWASDRAKLWNAAEVAETRKNSTVAREFEIALPAELTQEQRRELANELAREIVKKHGCGVDVCIHEPNKKGDQQNHHAHILLTTRRLSSDGFGEKTRELDERTSGAVDYWRDRFAQLQNAALERAGHSARVDHRSLENQGIERVPTVHLGAIATAIERRGEVSEKRISHKERMTAAASRVGSFNSEIVALDSSLKTYELIVSDMKKTEATRQQQKHITALIREEAAAEELNTAQPPARQLSVLELMAKEDAMLKNFDFESSEIEATRAAIKEAHKRELVAQPTYAGRAPDQLMKLVELRAIFVSQEKPASKREQALQRFDIAFSDPENLNTLIKTTEQPEEVKTIRKGRDDYSL